MLSPFFSFPYFIVAQASSVVEALAAVDVDTFTKQVSAKITEKDPTLGNSTVVSVPTLPMDFQTAVFITHPTCSNFYESYEACLTDLLLLFKPTFIAVLTMPY
jgi:hypothetical protein